MRLWLIDAVQDGGRERRLGVCTSDAAAKMPTACSSRKVLRTASRKSFWRHCPCMLLV
jgi:hypothetical protein